MNESVGATDHPMGCCLHTLLVLADPSISLMFFQIFLSIPHIRHVQFSLVQPIKHSTDFIRLLKIINKSETDDTTARHHATDTKSKTLLTLQCLLTADSLLTGPWGVELGDVPLRPHSTIRVSVL